MPGKFKNAMNIAGKVLSTMAEQEAAVTNMTNELMQRTYGLDLDNARKCARTLVNQAEVTWK